MAAGAPHNVDEAFALWAGGSTRACATLSGWAARLGNDLETTYVGSTYLNNGMTLALNEILAASRKGACGRVFVHYFAKQRAKGYRMHVLHGNSFDARVHCSNHSFIQLLLMAGGPTRSCVVCRQHGAVQRDADHGPALHHADGDPGGDALGVQGARGDSLQAAGGGGGGREGKWCHVRTRTNLS
jgi:hypothetical protein